MPSLGDCYLSRWLSKRSANHWKYGRMISWNWSWVSLRSLEPMASRNPQLAIAEELKNKNMTNEKSQNAQGVLKSGGALQVYWTSTQMKAPSVIVGWILVRNSGYNKTSTTACWVETYKSRTLCSCCCSYWRCCCCCQPDDVDGLIQFDQEPIWAPDFCHLVIY